MSAETLKEFPVCRGEIPADAQPHLFECQAQCESRGFKVLDLVKVGPPSEQSSARYVYGYNLRCVGDREQILAIASYVRTLKPGLMLPRLFPSLKVFQENRTMRMLQTLFANGFRLVLTDSMHIAKSVPNVKGARWVCVDPGLSFDMLLEQHCRHRDEICSTLSTETLPIRSIADYRSFPQRYPFNTNER